MNLEGLDALAERDNAAYVLAVHDKGLSFDLQTMSRRRMLGLAGGLGAFVLVGCGGNEGNAGTAAAASSTNPSAAGSTSATSGSSATSECAAEIDSETNGPYPADGKNGIDIRTQSGIARTDIRSSFGTKSTTATGVPLAVTLKLQNLSCEPIAGAAVYVWHCDASGNYSLYSSDITDENYLRGIAQTDATGAVTFTSIFPACYSGRWPHVHFEVYKSVADATSGTGTVIKTSQIAFPENVCDVVYATGAYANSVPNLSQVTLASDNVFGDDEGVHQLGTVTGSVAKGYTISLTVSVNPAAEESGNTGGGAPSSS